LSADQRALLPLLMAGDTYEQVAEVTGLSPADVRDRARVAADALGSDPPPDLPLEAVRDRLSALDSPQAGLPATPPPTPGAEAGLAARRWAVWLALGAVVVGLGVVLLVIGTGGGDGGSTTTDQGSQEDVVPIHLTAVGGAPAQGMISIVRVADQPAVDLAIADLTPSGKGESYVLWFVGSGGRSLPVAFHSVGADGKLTGRTAIPTAAEGLLPSFDTAVLTLTRQAAAAEAVRKAAQSSTLPQVVGTPVMRGTLP
jgi:hypothetical protein